MTWFVFVKAHNHQMQGYQAIIDEHLAEISHLQQLLKERPLESVKQKLKETEERSAFFN